MGMSGDWPLAVEEGSTMVRVGSSDFWTPKRASRMSWQDLRKRHERWFQGWLVLAPVVGFGSTTLVKNQLYRVWKVTHGLTDGVSAQEAREMGLTPPDWSGAMWYGVATMVVFTLFYVMAARTWSRLHHRRPDHQ